MGGSASWKSDTSYTSPYLENYKGTSYSWNVRHKEVEKAGLNGNSETADDIVTHVASMVDKREVGNVGNDNKYISGPEFAAAAEIVKNATGDDADPAAVKTVMQALTEMMKP